MLPPHLTLTTCFSCLDLGWEVCELHSADAQTWLTAVRSRGAGVKRLQRLGMIPEVPGMAALDMNAAEDLVVANTRELVPGMVRPAAPLPSIPCLA